MPKIQQRVGKKYYTFMKNIILTLVVLMMGTTVLAQRIAVLDFNAGTGVSQADVDGISAIFNTYFSPKGYTLVERTQIDRVIDEQRFQRGNLTQSQMVRIGEILNVSKVVIGDINLIMHQYNVDIRVVNVESGTIAAKDGATWTPGSSYRTMMSELGSRLAGQIAINTSSSTPVSQTKIWKVGDIYNVNGIKGIVFVVSSNGQHGRIVSLDELNKVSWYSAKQWCESYGEGWRLPTLQELELIYKNIELINELLFFEDKPQLGWFVWSSNEYSSSCCYSLGMGNGYNKKELKDGSGVVCDGSNFQTSPADARAVYAF